MNGSTLKMAGEEALRQNIAETKRYIEEHSGGGHSIVNSSGTVMTSRSKLKFKGQDITDDATNDTTVIEPEIKVVSTQEEWEQMTPQEKNNPNVTWLLPWKTNPDTNRHQIVNGNGTLFSDRAKLQIIGGYVEDDSENNTTKIYVWNALLTITTPSALLYGKTITIKKDGVTIGTVAFSAQGVASYSVHEVGTYKCYCDGYESDDISVEEEKAYSVVIRAGLDLHEWITAGSTTEYPLNPSSYADFSALEADEAAVRQLMLVHDAVDYLATATAGDTLMQSVINSDVCAKWINISDYALDTLSANSDIKSVMDTADKYGYGEWGKVEIASKGTASASAGASGYEAYYAFTPIGANAGWYISGAAYTNAWLKCDLSAKTKVTDVITYIQATNNTPTMTLNFSGSDDDVTYTPIKTGIVAHTTKEVTTLDTPANYRYYKWEITAFTGSSSNTSGFKANLLSYEPLGNVPIMTANNAPYGNALRSGIWSGSSYEAWMAFDGNDTDRWVSASNTAGQWIGFEFVNPIKPKRVHLKMEVLFESGYVQGSNSSDFSNPDNLYTFSNLSGTEIDFEIPDTAGYYKCLRVYCTNSGGGYQGNYKCYTLQFYGRELKPLVPTMTGNDNRIITDGYYKEVYPNAHNDFPYMAFDSDETSFWLSKPGPSDRYIGWNFGKATDIKYFALYGLGYGLSYPMYLMGSNDGENWETVYTIPSGTGGSGSIWVRDEVDADYKMYKVQTYIANTSGTRYVIDVCTLQFYGSDYSEKEFAQGSTRKTIYDHGVELVPIEISKTGTSTATKEPSQFYGSIAPSSNVQASYWFETVDKFDMSGYNTLWAKLGNKISGADSLNGGIWWLSAKFTVSARVGYLYVWDSTTHKTVNSVDISQAQDSYYIAYCYVSSVYAGACSLKELWLE